MRGGTHGSRAEAWCPTPVADREMKWHGVCVRVWDVAVVVAATWLGRERRKGQKENKQKQALKASMLCLIVLLVLPFTSSLVDEPFGSSRMVASELAPRICLSKSH